MKNLALIGFQVWAGVLVTITVGALIFAVVQLITGNYTGTASFEF